MKDEIKEILDDMKIVAEHKTVGVMGQQLNFKNARILLNYITNLQEENERLKELCDRYEEEHSTTFEYWKHLIKEDYKSRNEKAIEYIKQNSKCGGSFIDDKFIIEYIDEIFNGMKLLNILNGDDEE